jgi:hypothetical protein
LRTCPVPYQIAAVELQIVRSKYRPSAHSNTPSAVQLHRQILIEELPFFSSVLSTMTRR